MGVCCLQVGGSLGLKGCGHVEGMNRSMGVCFLYVGCNLSPEGCARNGRMEACCFQFCDNLGAERCDRIGGY